MHCYRCSTACCNCSKYSTPLRLAFMQGPRVLADSQMIDSRITMPSCSIQNRISLRSHHSFWWKLNLAQPTDSTELLQPKIYSKIRWSHQFSNSKNYVHGPRCSKCFLNRHSNDKKNLLHTIKKQTVTTEFQTLFKNRQSPTATGVKAASFTCGHLINGITWQIDH